MEEESSSSFDLLWSKAEVLIDFSEVFLLEEFLFHCFKDGKTNTENNFDSFEHEKIKDLLRELELEVRAEKTYEPLKHDELGVKLYLFEVFEHLGQPLLEEFIKYLLINEYPCHDVIVI